MSEPVDQPEYWKKRLKAAKEPHHAIFKCPLDRWNRIEAKHRALLLDLINPMDAVLDAGCGYGRLLTLLPKYWFGDYVGVDLSPDFVDLARKKHPLRKFITANLTDLSFFGGQMFDVAVLISIRPMVVRNLGSMEWDRMEMQVRKHARKLLFLEYDEHSEGELT